MGGVVVHPSICVCPMVHNLNASKHTVGQDSETKSTEHYPNLLIDYFSVWSDPRVKRDIRQIEKVQRRFTKRSYRLNSMSYNEQLEYLGLSRIAMPASTFTLLLRPLAGAKYCNLFVT